MSRRACLAIFLCGCPLLAKPAETPAQQAKLLLADTSRVGHLDAQLSSDSPDTKAYQAHDLDVYKWFPLVWAGGSGGRACFTTTYRTYKHDAKPSEATEVWTEHEYVITTFDSREEIDAMQSFPASGSRFDVEVLGHDWNNEGNIYFKLKLCGTPTNVKESASFLAVMEVPKDREHIGGLWLWQIDK